MAAESNTPAAGGGAKLERPSSGSRRLRAALWRSLVMWVKPIFSPLRDYLLAPLALLLNRRADGLNRRADGIEQLIGLLHAKFDAHAAETRNATECIQHQVQAIRADLEVLPKQLVQLEFQSRNFAKQLTQLASQFGILAEQLKHLESQDGSVQGQIERHNPMEHL